MKKTIIVTGGAGYVGSHLANLLAKKNYDIIIIDDFSNSYPSDFDKKIKLVKGDFSDFDLLKKIFAGQKTHQKIHAIFHLASFIDVGISMAEPLSYYKNNLVNSVNFLNWILQNSPESHFIFSSTAAVYEPKNQVLKEDDKKNPTSVYGKTKLMFEEILQDCARVHNLSFAILRYFNACGADFKNNLGENRKIENHLIPRLLRYLNRGDIDFAIFGNDYKTKDGTCIRDYVHINDICLAHFLALEYLAQKKPEARIFNIGSSKGFSVLEIINKTREITGMKFEIKFKERRKGDADFLVASNDLIKNTLGWKPDFSSLDEIINSAWQWEKILSKKNV